MNISSFLPTFLVSPNLPQIIPQIRTGAGFLHPKLFNKTKKGSKTKNVDINISVDILRCVMNDNCGVIFMMSGDGNYLPLIEEVMRHGKQVWIAAFSNGLSPNLRFATDYFIDLDKIFFKSDQTN